MKEPLTPAEKQQIEASGKTEATILQDVDRNLPQLVRTVSTLLGRHDEPLHGQLQTAVLDYLVYRWKGRSTPQKVQESYNVIMPEIPVDPPRAWTVKRTELINLIENAVDGPINKALGRTTDSPWIV